MTYSYGSSNLRGYHQFPSISTWDFPWNHQPFGDASKAPSLPGGSSLWPHARWQVIPTLLEPAVAVGRWKVMVKLTSKSIKTIRKLETLATPGQKNSECH